MSGARGRFMTVALLCVALCSTAAFAAPAADSPRLGDVLRMQFPVAAHAIGLDGGKPGNPKQIAANARSNGPRSFGEPLALDNGRERVLVRPVASHATAALAERDGTAFLGGFRGVDVLRTNGREVLIVRDAKALAALRYEASDVSNRAFAVQEGRGVRFVPFAGRNGVGSQLAISAPFVFDAAGRVSTNARWTVGPGHDTSAWLLQLRVEDKGLRYPLAVVFSAGSVAEAKAALAKTAASTGKMPRVGIHGTGVIAGRLTDGESGRGLEGEAVTLFTGTGDYVDTAITGADGAYNFFNLDTGSYRAIASATGYPSEIYNEIPCGAEGCDPLDGTPISVTDGQTTVRIDFTLGAERTRLGGYVFSDADLALTDMTVVAYDGAGTAAAATTTDGNGFYEFVFDDGGTFYVRTHNAQYEGVIDEVYDDVACAGCDVTSGRPVVLADGDSRSDVDFLLATNGGRISGKVTETSTGRGLSGATVAIYNDAGVEVTNAYGDLDGNYLSFHGLPAGNYHAIANAADYNDELYDEMPCTGRSCDPTNGDDIAVAVGATTGGIDFTLGDAVVRARGRVTDAADSSPIRDIYVFYFDENGQYVAGAASGDDGSYEVILPGDGTYFAMTRNFFHPEYLDELYDNIPCSECDVTTGTEIEATAAAPALNIDFGLSTNGHTIAGRVIDAATSAPIVNAFVQLYSDTGNPVAYGYSDGNGDWVSFQHLAPGTYYAIGYASGYDAQLYNGKDCDNGCDPLTGDAITVTSADVTGVNFQLSEEGCADIDIQPDSLPGALPGQPYSQQLSVVGGNPPYVFQHSSGDLPPGMTFTSDGLLAGTPTTAGEYSFLITVADANGCGGSQTYTLIVQGTATTTTLTASATTVQLGQSVTLTANVSPANVTGSVSFSSNTDVLGVVVLDGVTGQAQLTVSLPVGEHETFAEYTGDGTFSGSTSAEVLVTVTKAQPVITWATPAPITYPEALSSTQLNATANVAGTFTYNPAEGTVLAPGTQTLSVHFVPEDAGLYDEADASVQLVVNKGSQTISWSNPAEIVYGTPLDGTQLNATVTASGPEPAGELVYNPAAGAILDAGTQTLSVTGQETDFYNAATATVQIVVLKATPEFSELSEPVVIIGAASTTISGKIAAGTLIPPGNVAITVNGVTQNAAIQADGSFAASFATGAWAIGTYPIAFSYAGSNNFHPASGSSTLIVTYGVAGEPIPNHPKGSSGTIPVTIKLVNASGQNISSAQLTLTPHGLRLTGESTWSPVQTISPTFKFQNSQGGQYKINIRPNNIPAGTYEFGFTVTGDPLIHYITFIVQ